jgi:hypothetical protein
MEEKTFQFQIKTFSAEDFTNYSSSRFLLWFKNLFQGLLSLFSTVGLGYLILFEQHNRKLNKGDTCQKNLN